MSWYPADLEPLRQRLVAVRAQKIAEPTATRREPIRPLAEPCYPELHGTTHGTSPYRRRVREHSRPATLFRVARFCLLGPCSLTAGGEPAPAGVVATASSTAYQTKAIGWPQALRPPGRTVIFGAAGRTRRLDARETGRPSPSAPTTRAQSSARWDRRRAGPIARRTTRSPDRHS